MWERKQPELSGKVQTDPGHERREEEDNVREREERGLGENHE